MSNVTALPAQTVDTRYTQDVIPTLDTSKFEHMQRLATVMAKMSTIPESLRGTRDGANFLAFPNEVVVANCFRIVNQSVRWGFDPFAVVDCCSVVHGKLMWEGKLVAAVLDAKLGVRLAYTFTNEDKPNDQSLGVIVSGTLPGETTARTIEGTVAGWHRGPKSPWNSPSAWKRQLRYMGAREWARAHAPAVMLGVYTDDELDDIASRDVPAGHRAVRMKDITPPAPAAVTAIPFDIPDPPAAPVEAEASQEVPAEAVLRDLEKALATATSAAAVKEVRAAFASQLATLDEASHDTAIDMIEATLQAAE